METASAGRNNDADNPVTGIARVGRYYFCYGKSARNKLQKNFKRHLNGARVICLDIPDDYEFMDPALVRLLEARVPRFL